MHKLSIIPNILMEQRGGGKIVGYSRQSWQRLQNTQVVNCVRIQNSAGEKITFANLIYLSKVPILGSSCEGQNLIGRKRELTTTGVKPWVYRKSVNFQFCLNG